VREEASSGLGRLTLIRKCGATPSGAAQATAAPPSLALHLPWQAPLSLRGSHCRATGSGAAPTSAAPPWMARQKRVILVKLFRRWFIFYDCIKFRLILSKLPQKHNHNLMVYRPGATSSSYKLLQRVSLLLLGHSRHVLQYQLNSRFPS
jgi:hypothetical protein